MNLFVTDFNPEITARHLDDKRIGSALREANQMMSLAVKMHTKDADQETLNKKHVGEGKLTEGFAHKNHPVSIWVRASRANWDWTWEYAHHLSDEYEVRYGKRNASEERTKYLRQFRLVLPPGDMLPFQNSAKNEGLGLDFSDYPVPESYQRYLLARWPNDKRAVTFTNRGEPEWMADYL